MIKKLILVTFTFLFLFIVLTSLETKALTFDKLPTKQISKQWSVQVGEVELDKGSVKPVKRKFQTYSLKIDKVGKDVYSLEVNLYKK